MGERFPRHFAYLKPGNALGFRFGDPHSLLDSSENGRAGVLVAETATLDACICMKSSEGSCKRTPMPYTYLYIHVNIERDIDRERDK